MTPNLCPAAPGQQEVLQVQQADVGGAAEAALISGQDLHHLVAGGGAESAAQNMTL